MRQINGTALVIVDVQNDFCKGGSLAITGGDKVSQRIADFIRAKRSDYDLLVTTQDWHIDPGDHFESWPVHCMADTSGSELKSEITSALRETDSLNRFYIPVYKGQYDDGYSGFKGRTKNKGKLDDTFKRYGIKNLHIVGLATDFCVKATAVDAMNADYNTLVITELTAGVAKNSKEIAEKSGVNFVSLEKAAKLTPSEILVES